MSYLLINSGGDKLLTDALGTLLLKDNVTPVQADTGTAFDPLLVNANGDTLVVNNLDDELTTGSTSLVAYNYSGDELFAVDSLGKVIDTEYLLTYAGLQLAFLPFKPNWSTPVTETLEWKTDVLASYSGKEQRRSLRIRPRRGITYDYMLKGVMAELHDTLLWGWHSRSFVVPMWQDRCQLSEDTLEGTSIVNITADGSTFADNSLAVIYVDERTYEILRVTTSSAGQLTLLTETNYSWAKGINVYPLCVAHLNETVNSKWLTDTLLTGRFELTCNPEYTDANLPDNPATTTYKGLDIIEDDPNWIDGIENNFLNEFKKADGGTGAIKYFNAAASRMTRPYKFFLKGKTAIQAFREFVARRRGQAVSFWVPSWHTDLEIAFPDLRISEDEQIRWTEDGLERTIEASGSFEDYSRKRVFYIKGTMFGRMFGGNPQRHVMIKLSGADLYTTYTENDNVRITEDGNVKVSEDWHGVGQEYYYREIVAAFPAGTVTQVVVDEPFEGVLTPDDVLWIKRLYQVRLASDKVEIPYVTEEFSEPILNLTLIP